MGVETLDLDLEARSKLPFGQARVNHGASPGTPEPLPETEDVEGWG